jgi:hypothetical protein
MQTWLFELLRCTVLMLQSAVMCLLFCHGDQLAQDKVGETCIIHVMRSLMFRTPPLFFIFFFSAIISWTCLNPKTVQNDFVK